MKESARLRLAALVDPAIAVLQKCLKGFEKNPEVAERAARAILDRTGFAATAKLEHTGVNRIDIDPRELLRRKIAELKPRTPGASDLVQ